MTCTREAPWARHRSVDAGLFSRAHARFHEGPFNVQVVVDGGADGDGPVVAWPDRLDSVGPGDEYGLVLRAPIRDWGWWHVAHS